MSEQLNLVKILYPELSYAIQGAIFFVANTYGKGLKEIVYQKALAEAFTNAKLSFEEQKRINIYSLTSGKVLGTYVPDFIVDNKIVLELKASTFTTRENMLQQQSYLKASIYEVGYLINFCTPRLFMKRSIYTNDRKPFITQLAHS